MNNSNKKLLLVLSGAIALLLQTMNAQNITNTNSELMIVRQLKNLPDGEVERTLSNLSANRISVQRELLDLLENSNSEKMKESAAYLLGIYRMDAAVPMLARFIALSVKPQLQDHEALILGYPAKDALIKIGNPSIPAMIRNLTESDDAKVRDLSFQVLCRIDGDKEISQLRLQKALKMETDSQKQARLQAALKSLAELK